MFIVNLYQSIKAPEERSFEPQKQFVRTFANRYLPYLQGAPMELLVNISFCYYKQFATP
jgi:hypothetical protein